MADILKWCGSLTLDNVILLIMMIFAIIGAIDRTLDNRYGYGAAFEEGFGTMGPLALAVAAVYAAAPLIARCLTPIATSISDIIGSDSGTLPGLLISADMGGYAICTQMASSDALGNFGGLIIASTVGTIWFFTIPIALSILKEDDLPLLAAGLLCGLVTMPIGCFVGGLLMNTTTFTLSLSAIVYNILPLMALAIVVGAALWFIPNKTINFFRILGKIVIAVITLLTAVLIFEQVTGIHTPILGTLVTEDESGSTMFNQGLLLCGKIAIVLAGAFPMIKWLQKHCSGIFRRIGNSLGINSVASIGLLSSCANCIPTFATMKDMDSRGKLLNSAFIAGGSFALGDFLGFAAGVEPKMVFPMIGAKLTCGITAIILAQLLYPVLQKRLGIHS